jgi:CHAT domain-containing protein/tetratricopeptide (TPR) repeat protein
LFKFARRSSYLTLQPLLRAFALDDGHVLANRHFSYKEIAAHKIGAMYDEARCPRNAVVWFRRSLQGARDVGIEENILLNLYRLACALETARLLDEAGSCYREIIRRLGETPSHEHTLQWLIPAAMFEIHYGESSRGEAIMQSVMNATLESQHPDDRPLPTSFLAALAALGQHATRTHRFADAIELGRRLLQHAGRFDSQEWATWTAHGLIAKALIQRGEFDAALEELAHVHDVNATVFVSLGTGYHTEALEQWIDVARLHMALGRYEQAIAAYDILAAHLGAYIANRNVAVTTRERLYWLQQQTLVVEEMASAWLTITNAASRGATEAVVANALLQLKANLFISIEVHTLDVLKSGDVCPALFHANRSYAAAFREVEANSGDPKTLLALEDALFRREDIERRMITGDMIPDPGISSMLHRDFREIAALGRDTLAIDYSLIDYRPPQDGSTGVSQGARYLGVRLVPGEISIVDLSDAPSIDALCKDYVSAIVSRAAAPRRHLYAGPAPSRAANEADADRLAKVLYERLVAPFEPLSGSVLIAPEGMLAAVPFHALLRQNRYLIEDVDVACCHSLLKRESISRRQLSPGRRFVPNIDRTALLLGDPDYRGRDEEALPGTRLEVESVASLLREAKFQSGDNVFEEVRIFTDRKATAPRLLDIDYPRVVHIAAHGAFSPWRSAVLTPPSPPFGFYYRRWEELGTEPVSRLDYALLRSTLALAADPSAHDPAHGAILTALEVSSLNLFGCHVVVLSACETALGDSISGAGVLGFQYALLTSFAKSAIVSLWKILDHETVGFMERFYSKFLEQQGVRAGYLMAMRDACRQGDRRVHPYYWAAFLLLDQEYYHPVF